MYILTLTFLNKEDFFPYDESYIAENLLFNEYFVFLITLLHKNSATFRFFLKNISVNISTKKKFWRKQ